MSGNTFNPPPSSEDKADKMRGDAVGSTLYSERWILKILMHLTKLTREEWNSELESEVCVLWDMSAEEDVVHLLLRHDMFGLAVQIIVDFDDCRLTEIMVGIIGNMCCIKSVRTELGKRSDVVDVLLELLTMPDVQTLLQVLRVFQTCAWDSRGGVAKEGIKRIREGQEPCTGETDEQSRVQPMSDDVDMNTECCGDEKPSESVCAVDTSDAVVQDPSESSCAKAKDTSVAVTQELSHSWLQHFTRVDRWLPKILFILSSSKHDELLSCTWSFLSTVCYIPVCDTVLSQQVVHPDLMTVLLESYKEYFEVSFRTYETHDIEPVKKAATHWVSVLYSFTLHREGVQVLCQFKEDVLSCIFNLLHYCHSLLALDEQLVTFITSSVAILDVIFFAEPHEWSHFTSGLLSAVKLWEELSESKTIRSKDNQSTGFEEEAMKSLEEFFISVHAWLEENKDKDAFKKLRYIHNQLTQMLNSRVT